MDKRQSTVFVIEDDPAVCESLRWLFESVGLQVEIYHNGADYLAAHDPSRCGCLLIDVRLPGMSGLALQQALVERNNPIPVIIITGHGDVTLAVRAMKAGAKDFILKPYNNELLLELIQQTIAESNPPDDFQPLFAERIKLLSRRELEVLDLMMAGNLNKQVAAKLGISLSTVEQHRAHIMQKTQARSLAQLIKHYVLLNK